MTDFKITEAGSVQFPMVKHAAAVGWTRVTPRDAVQKRGGEENMFFRDELEKALAKLNQWMTEDARRQVIDRLEATQAMIDGNWEMLAWLRGEQQWYDEEERLQRRVQLVDFENPGTNKLHVTWEWKFKPPARKGNQADVMFVVNGVPVCLVEHKNPADRDAIERGIMQLRRYEEETPEMMVAPQLFNVTHLLDYWYGVTWNTNRRFMARWKWQGSPEETYKFAVQSFFEPTDFLRTLQHWILFYVEDGKTRKSILRQHQRTAIDKITARCKDLSRRRGLIWHTQGSGKTFTLLTAARLVLEQQERFKHATVLVVADRLELESQLKGWVDRLLGEMHQQDILTCRVDSRGELREHLQEDRRGLILSMIHKFKGLGRNVNERDNIYVFIDEAHRSVARELGTELMAALPKATIIGFTGTPVDRTAHGQGTFKIFGTDDSQGYLDKYSIAESIKDETTLPIRHTMVPNDMTVPEARLDEDFFELAEAAGITDVDELNRVLDRAVNLRTFLTADDRIEKVAAFVARHFKENVHPLGYKAFLVAVNREGCAKYKQALDELLPTEWTAAVYTKNEADKVRLPLVAKWQLSDDREKEVRRLFQKADKKPQILIVTDKLLTGYDAPLLYCMYLDKPMRDHVLLQALARVNRPYVDNDGVRKNVGLVVDFVGVLRKMEKALRFDSADMSGVIENLDLLMEDFFRKIAAAKKDYLDNGSEGTPDERLEKLVYRRLMDSEARQAFFETYKEIEVLWEILAPAPELQEHIDTFKRLAQLYKTVRNAYAKRVDFIADLAHKTKRLVQESIRQEDLDRLTKSITFDVETLKTINDKPGLTEAKVFNLVRGIREEAANYGDQVPMLRSLLERVESIREEFQNRQIGTDDAMGKLQTLAVQKEAVSKEAQESGLSPRASAVLWKLRDDTDLAAAGIQAADLARQVDVLLDRFPNAAVNTEEERQLRGALYIPLLKLGDNDARTRVVGKISTILRNLGEQ